MGSGYRALAGSWSEGGGDLQGAQPGNFHLVRGVRVLRVGQPVACLRADRADHPADVAGLEAADEAGNTIPACGRGEISARSG